MMKNIAYRIRVCCALFALYIFSALAYAQDNSPVKISTFCSADDIKDINCGEAQSCASELNRTIADFVKSGHVPTSEALPDFKYPRKCRYRSEKIESVNVTYTIRPNGKPANVSVLNSSNECFDRTARNHFRKLRFPKSAGGYVCVPGGLIFVRRTMSDASGNSY